MKEPHPSQLKEAWVLCFLLGVVMLNYPFIHIFNKDSTLFGIPILVLYLMVGWPLSIMVVFLFTKLLDRDTNSDSSDRDKQ